MCPSGISLKHPMASLLLEYAKNGYQVDCGKNWTKEHIEAAVKRGPHIHKDNKEAAEYAWAEAIQRENNGFCRIHKWDDVKHVHPPQLKVSPIAAIPHKSRPFRMILDLSFRIKVNNVEHPSVNNTTV